MFHKRVIAAAVGAALALTLAACSSSRGTDAATTSAAAANSETAAASSPATKSSAASGSSSAAAAPASIAKGNGELIGVTMPTSSSQRWIQDGANVKSQLEAAGYKVDLQYAENDIPTQLNQVDNQITNDAKKLINT